MHCTTYEHLSTSDDQTASTKLGKRARKALKAQQRKDEAQSNATPESSVPHQPSGQQALPRPGAGLAQSSILKVRDVIPERTDQHRDTSNAEPNDNRIEATKGFSGSMFRDHIASLLSGFGGAASKVPDEQPDAHAAGRNASGAGSGAVDPGPSKDAGSTGTVPLTKSERMESQARVIFQAIREARERGMVDEDESFFYPYPEGVPPKDVDGRDSVWLNLGPDPEAWGKDIPSVQDRWLEALSLSLTKEIVVSDRPDAQANLNHIGEESSQEERDEQEAEFRDLVEDFDLEDHERLEQLGDSIVNMSSRLLAYEQYPDVNEGALTRISNYPTQNNFLALLFQECGLASRRNELRTELRSRNPEYTVDIDEGESATPGKSPRVSKRTIQRGANKASESDESDASRLPLLIKSNADMFEAYAAAVFLSHGRDFGVVHAWLSELFRPFQDQAYRFMVQRSEALSKHYAIKTVSDVKGTTTSRVSPGQMGFGSSNAYATNSGITAPLSDIFPSFVGSDKRTSSGNGLYHSEPFIVDEFLTVAARARRQREARMREKLRRQDQEELMNMGWFRKGFLNLQTGFRQYVLGKDIALEKEQELKRRIAAERGRTEREIQRMKTKERIQPLLPKYQK
ncbi:hypothetical protein BCV70DRAFT_213506 [Testicularia cyperi]|uniref:RNase III domain-containing protein n=1 Tax=Testicularia cyperi TaxID=1882483 RepID=A0A317XH95_9BASI|nr:hypothetical protein BCV70DRAFT_213506 [Testicularia cyperi]